MAFANHSDKIFLAQPSYNSISPQNNGIIIEGFLCQKIKHLLTSLWYNRVIQKLFTNVPPGRRCTYMITYKQISLADIFSDYQNKFDNDKYAFLSLLDETLNSEEIVPVSFVYYFHASTKRPSRHLLFPILKALFLQAVFPSQRVPC